VANRNGGSVTVIDGANNTTATVATGLVPTAVAVNPVTNRIYVGSGAGTNVTVIDGTDNTTTKVAARLSPGAVAVKPVTYKIYVANSDHNDRNPIISVDDSADNATVTFTQGGE